MGACIGWGEADLGGLHGVLPVQMDLAFPAIEDASVWGERGKCSSYG
jgi:hypothetical protein